MAEKDIKIAGDTYKSVPKILMSTTDGGTAEYVETSDATATADNLAKNATAYVNGELVTGVYDGSDKQDKLTFDTTPTADSTNPVTSDGIKDYADTKVDKSGDTMTGALNVPKINSIGDKDKREIATGVNESSYFQSRKFRGEGDANTYYHAVDFGYAGHNQVDFHEYGGVWNFLRNKGGKSTTGLSAGSIQYDKGWVGKVNGYDIGMSLPSGSKLTDTVYDDSKLSARVTALENKTDSDTTYTFTADTATDSTGATQDITVTKVNGHSVGIDVPADAKFTDKDTTYTFSADKVTASDGTEQTVTVTKVNGHAVKADVPENAVFTDTVTNVISDNIAGYPDDTTSAASPQAIFMWADSMAFPVTMTKSQMDYALSNMGMATPLTYTYAKNFMANVGTMINDEYNCVNVLAMAEIINALCQQIDSNANGISAKQDALTFDITPTAGSTNPVTSGGIKAYVDANAKYDDTALKNRVTALEGKEDKDTIYDDTAIKAEIAKKADKSEIPEAYDDTALKSRVDALETKFNSLVDGNEVSY